MSRRFWVGWRQSVGRGSTVGWARRPKTRGLLHSAGKIGALVALAASVAVPAPTLAQAQSSVLHRIVGLDLSSVTLEEALGQLQRNTGIGLVYSPDRVPVTRLVSCPCMDSTVSEALEVLLLGTELTFTASRNQVRIVPQQPAQERPTDGNIAGLVLNAGNGGAIPNALIQLSDGRGSLSNENGRFILVNVPSGTYSLTVSGLGWDPAEVEGIEVVAGGTARVEIPLTRRVIPLSELVVAPGTFGILDEVSDFALQTLSREQIETLPQIGEDVFRSLRRLPGVASGDISTKLHLRGGRDREVLYLLDGMELYEPYHLKDFEGTLGVIDIHAIGGIDLHAGGFPVDFSNRMAGVFDMETRRPPEEGMKTTLGLSITNASFMSRGAFEEGRGQWLLSARRGYLDIALSMTDVDPGISPKYYDVLGKVQYQVGAKNVLSAHLLHAGDHLDLEQDALEEDVIGDLVTGWDNTYGWITWKSFLSPRVRARTVASAGRVTRSRIGDMEEPGRIIGPEFVQVSDVGSFDFLGLKHEWTIDVTDNFAARAGFNVKGLWGDFDYSSATRTLVADYTGERVGETDSLRVKLDPTGTEAGGFVAGRFRPVPWGTAELGVRYDRHTHTGDSDFSPRVHTIVDLSENTTVRAGWGQYTQAQDMNELEVGDGETEFAPSERATQIALGVEHRLNNGLSARLEAYTRRVDHPRREYLNLWREILPFPERDGDRYRVDPTEARARGLELLVAQDAAEWDWSASYVLSESEDRIDGQWVPRFIDQRHAFTTTLGYHPGPNWTLSAAWHIHSGWPFTPQVIQFDTLTVFRGVGENWPLNWKEEFGATNSSRLPSYHRLDLRATRRFQVGRGTLDIYVDLFNAYNQENLRSFDYGLESRNEKLMYIRYPDETLLPILPSIGFRWEF
ncbi:TonB-dependent receptor domain-containing protein [Gemmatimonadota bacterium]